MLDYAYYDRRIDLAFYNNAGRLLGTIETPETGRPPAILAKGTFIAGRTSISTDVSVVNLDSLVKVQEIYWLFATLHYSNFKEARLLKLKVLWADVSKTPPDKTVVFHCIEACQDISLMETRLTFSFGGPGETFKLTDVLRTVISKFNATVAKEYPGLNASLLLNTEPELGLSQDVTLTGKFSAENETIYEVLNKLEMRIIVYDDNAEDPYQLLPILISITNGRVYVGVRVEDATKNFIKNPSNVIKLDYVISAVRHGPILTVTTMFDPRIAVGSVAQIPMTALIAKQVGGELVMDLKLPEVQPYLTFGVDVRVDFAFGTVEQNSMIMVGLIREND